MHLLFYDSIFRLFLKSLSTANHLGAINRALRLPGCEDPPSTGADPHGRPPEQTSAASWTWARPRSGSFGSSLLLLVDGLHLFWKVMPVGYVTAESQNVQPHWGFHCCATLRKRELLKARCFRQLARKSEENFGKKREGRTVPALLTKSNLAIRFLRIVHSLKNCP